MEKQLQDIFDSVTDDKPRSRLERHRELILRLHRDGRSYRRIIKILEDKCDVRVTLSTLHPFIRRRSRPRKAAPTEMASTNTVIDTQTSAPPESTPATQPGSWPSRRMTPEDAAKLAHMQAPKAKPLDTPVKKKRYEYNPDEPLILEKPIKEK